jgi:hypothetical protein
MYSCKPHFITRKHPLPRSLCVSVSYIQNGLSSRYEGSKGKSRNDRWRSLTGDIARSDGGGTFKTECKAASLSSITCCRPCSSSLANSFANDNVVREVERWWGPRHAGTLRLFGFSVFWRHFRWIAGLGWPYTSDQALTGDLYPAEPGSGLAAALGFRTAHYPRNDILSK